MKNNKKRINWAWRLAIIHTALLVSIFSLTFVHWENPDSCIAFILVVLMNYFVDFPIGMAYEKIITPLKNDDFLTLWAAISISWFVILGGLYWFCIG